MIRIILKPGEEGRILAGHPWVYDNEVDRILSAAPSGRPLERETLKPGELADIEGPEKHYRGRAFVNPHSRIIARIYSRSKEGLDKGLVKRRIREALSRRSAYDLRRESARIIFAEADFLPGLIVDRFVGWPREALDSWWDGGSALDCETLAAVLGPPGSWLVVQFLAAGMDIRREDIIAALEEVFARDSYPAGDPSSGEPGLPLGSPLGIMEKPVPQLREREGIAPREDLFRGQALSRGLLIDEHGFPFAVPLEEGQKTGCFLDQRDNRLLAASFAPGKRVLDACAYTGGFGIHAARRGARSVIAVDSSAAALETAALNARLNGVADRFQTQEEDVFEFLRRYEGKNERFDLIILDPPAFAKSHTTLEGALRGYKEINLRSLKLLSPGGVLISCSCSQALDEGRFRRMISAAAADAGRRLYEIDFRSQAADHPRLVGYGESQYLKCGFYRVM